MRLKLEAAECGARQVTSEDGDTHIHQFTQHLGRADQSPKLIRWQLINAVGSIGSVCLQYVTRSIMMRLFRSRFLIACLFSFAEYLAACCEDEGEENPP